jgi:hypothetical protein
VLGRVDDPKMNLAAVANGSDLAETTCACFWMPTAMPSSTVLETRMGMSGVWRTERGRISAELTRHRSSRWLQPYRYGQVLWT